MIRIALVSLRALQRTIVSCICAWTVQGAAQLVAVGPLPHSADYPIAGVQFITQLDGWAYNMEGLWRTQDGGRRWNRVSLPLPNLGDFHFESTNVGWVVVSGNGPSGSLYRTTDGGGTWTLQPKMPGFGAIDFMPGGAVGWVAHLKLSDPPPRITIAPGCIYPANQSLLEPEIFHTTDGGLHWAKQSLPDLGGCPISKITFRNSHDGIAAAGHRLYYTSDGGTTWRRSEYLSTCSNDTWVRDEWNEALHIFFRGDIGWIGSSNGFLLKTGDGGKHWCVLKKPGEIAAGGGLGDFGVVYFDSPQRGLILGTDHRIYETNEGGLNWLKIEGGGDIDSLFCDNDACWAVSDKLYRIQLDPVP